MTSGSSHSSPSARSPACGSAKPPGSSSATWTSSASPSGSPDRSSASTAAGSTSALPKYGSERVIYLAHSFVNLLAEHVANQGTTGKNRWLFAGEEDGPPHQNTVGYWWRTTLRDAGLSGIKLHDLRHFYASGLIAAGCDVVTVQRSLGHSKATTTLSTYAHLWPTAEDRTRNAAASIMSAPLGQPAVTLAELAANAGA